jgi:hypothetical protein
VAEEGVAEVVFEVVVELLVEAAAAETISIADGAC